jgi:hypothetical protein
MRRISIDDLEYCRGQRECLVCHYAGQAVPSTRVQKRGRLDVPCCRLHFLDYEIKAAKRNARKYARRVGFGAESGRCVRCPHKLIPREILPSPARERTCGLHGSFKAFHVNRAALVEVITEKCLSLDERKDMILQDIFYKRGNDFVVLGMQHPGYYHTKIFSARGLLQLYHDLHRNELSPRF